MSKQSVILIGASGFVGGEVLKQLRAQKDRINLRILVHEEMPNVPIDRNIDIRYGDITIPESLNGIFEGIDVVIHAASHIGSDPARCDKVNRLGTFTLADAASRNGVKNIIYLSTAAVYGDGIHRGIKENQILPRPASATSRSRLAAEEIIVLAGGIVVRPMFILGLRDRWFLPTLFNFVKGINSWVDGGQARLSCVTVEVLADALIRLALAPPDVIRQASYYHCCHPEPVRVKDIITEAAAFSKCPIPRKSISLPQALRILPQGVTERQAHLFSVDRWYDSSLLWKTIGMVPQHSVLHECRAFWRKS